MEFKPKWMLCEVSLFKTLSLESWQREAIVSEEATFIFREFGEFGQEGAVFHCPWGTVKPQVGSTPLPAHPAYHWAHPFSSHLFRHLPDTSFPSYRYWK